MKHLVATIKCYKNTLRNAVVNFVRVYTWQIIPVSGVIRQDDEEGCGGNCQCGSACGCNE